MFWDTGVDKDGNVIGASPPQRDLFRLLGGSASHVLAYGGSRSGKTYAIIRAIVMRALMTPNSSHAIFRLTFNSLRSSIIDGTLPAVMKNEFPDVKWHLDRTNWVVELPDNSKIYLGGLDTKERTEKILGQEHATLFFNEVSQISYASVLKALTRLAQKRKTRNGKWLRLKAYYDENPPQQGHWSYKLFIKKIEPLTGAPLPDAKDYDAIRLNPRDNPHVPEEYLVQLQRMPPKERKRFFDGEFVPALDNQLWSYEQVANCYVFEAKLPDMSRVLVAIDPSGCSGPEDKRSDEVGIVVVGLGIDGVCYVLEDASGRYGPGGPDGWGAKSISMYRKWQADCIIAESNFGGAMVVNTISTVDSNVPVREVTASRGKVQRAEPVSALYAKGLVKHLTQFEKLEEQLCNFSTGGYMGERSPDRADAMIWAVSDLAVTQVPGLGLLAYYEQQAREQDKVVIPKMDHGWIVSGNEEIDATQSVTLVGKPDCSSVIYGMQGRKYVLGADRRIVVAAEDVGPLLGAGFEMLQEHHNA